MKTPDALSDLIARHMARREVLQGFVGGVFASMLPGCLPKGGSSEVSPIPTPPSNPLGGLPPLRDLTFQEVSHGLDDLHHVSEGYQVTILIGRGDSLFDDTPDWDPQYQDRQIGDCCDFLAFVPLSIESEPVDRGLLCINHEICYLSHYWPDGRVPEHPDGAMRALAEQSAIGHSVVEIRRVDGTWVVAKDSPYNRRITGNTLCHIRGPAAGHPRLQTSEDPTGARVLGTLANCSGGQTPWGTILSGEENIYRFFRTPTHEDGTLDVGIETEHLTRMFFGGDPYFSWYQHASRFDVGQEPHEPNRFGWVVEIDPRDPTAPPIKHTALGRFFHEGAEVVLNADGRIVVYMGDDSGDEYLYRYVSAGVYDPDDRQNASSLLDDGTLYVARFDDDGLTWMPLDIAEEPFASSQVFASQGDLLIETRQAADLVGATPMDRPERVTVSPRTGRVVVALTKHKNRTTANAANPRTPNPCGHLLELIPPDGDHVAERFAWTVLLMAGDPKDPDSGAVYHPEVSDNGWFAAPDNCIFDPGGRLWITTDGSERLGFADGLYACHTEGERRACTRLFFRGPVGSELTGPCFSPDGRSMFLSVQHPGADSEFADPNTRWPDFDPTRPPRSAVVVLTRPDGAIIGD